MTFGMEFLLAGKNAESRAARIWRGLILTVAAVAASMAFIVLTRRAAATSHWQPTPCRVIESSVEVSAEESETPYSLSLSYVYDTPAGTTVGSKYRFTTPPRGRDAAEIFALARQWPVGLRSTCYVNPADTQKAVLVLPDVRLWKLSTAGVVSLSVLLIVFYCVPQLMRPKPKRQQGRSTVELLYIALWTMACATLFGWMCVEPLMQNVSAARWPAVPCTIEHARLSFEELRGELPLTLYRTDLLYRYVFNGVEYHSNCFSLTELASPMSTGRRKRVAESAAQPQMCYVDPTNPPQAVMTRRVSPTQWLSVWVGIFFLLGVYVLIPRRARAGFDATLRRSRWTLGSVFVLLLILTVLGLSAMP